MGKIKVVQMLPDLQSGGVERGTLELGKFLSKNGHSSIVISGGGRMVPQLEREGSKHITWQIGGKSLSTLRYILPLRKLLAKEKVDILHLRSRVPAWLGYLTWKTISPQHRPRLLTTFHGFYSVHKFSAIMTYGEKIIAISQTIADHIKKEYQIPDEQIEIIHRGVDIKAFDPAIISKSQIQKLRNQWDLNDDPEPLIILPGRITDLKGHDILIQALSNLKKQAWTCILVGDPTENTRTTNQLRKMIRDYGLKNRIKFGGHCSDMPTACQLADIVVSATSTKPEAFGRVAIEAGAMAKPVIASAHGGSIETVLPNKTGWLVEPNNSKSMEQALALAISGKDLCEKFGKQGQEWVRKNFTTDKMCERTLSIYQKLLNIPK